MADGQRSTATCGGRLSCSAMVRSTSQAARFGARGRDTVHVVELARPKLYKFWISLLESSE